MSTARWVPFLAALSLLAAVACPPAGGQTPSSTSSGSAEERRITVDLRDARIDDALRIIFRDTSYSFTLEPGITGRVTLSLQEAPFQTALRAILNSNNPKLTFRKEANDVYVITQMQPQAPSPVKEVVQPASEQQVYWIGPGGRYQFQYLDCRDVAYWFGGYSISGTPTVPSAIAGFTGGGGTGGGASLGSSGSGSSRTSGTTSTSSSGRTTGTGSGSGNRSGGGQSGR